MRTSVWIFAAAGYNVALALFHLCFWRVFRWRDELVKLHPANRGVMQVLNIMLTFVFLAVAALQLGWADEMSCSSLGRALLVVLVGFWVIRAALQPLFWKAVPRATNWAFVALFAIGAGLHFMALGPG